MATLKEGQQFWAALSLGCHGPRLVLHYLEIERHGLDGLAGALEYASEYVDGAVNHRIDARELDLSPLEAEIILQALEPVAIEYAD